MLGLLFSVDDITGFEITKAIELPQPYGIIFVWGLVLPSLFILANALTSLAFRDALIVKVPRHRRHCIISTLLGAAGSCPHFLAQNFSPWPCFDPAGLYTTAASADVSPSALPRRAPAQNATLRTSHTSATS